MSPSLCDIARAAERARASGDARLQASMLDLLVEVASFARPAISGYRVGAVGCGATGALYPGVNLEFPGVGLNQTVHAEQFVVARAAAAGETRLTELAVSALPCGHCRQFLNELAGGGDLRILVADGTDVLLEELLPRSFGPLDLGVEAGMLASAPNDLALDSDDELVLQALAAARRAYAPYSRCPSGLALQLEGRAVTGSCAENAAFNPGLPPLQAALIELVAQGLDYQQIERAALVEGWADGANRPSQEPATRALLASIAPGAHLTVVRATPL